MSEEFINILPLWSLLINFYKASYNILLSSPILQVLLPYQEASLITNVSIIRARMVFYQLEADSDSSHRVRFVFLIARWLSCTLKVFRSLRSSDCYHFHDLFFGIKASLKFIQCTTFTFGTNTCLFSNSHIV